MIKVEHTKSVLGYLMGSPNPNATLVTDAELVLVKDIGGILAQEGNGKFNIVPGAPNIPSIEQLNISKAVLPITYYEPILISRTEKIEVGDWFYNSNTKQIVKCIDNTSLLPICYKILALPEHFSPQQLQDIVDGKLIEGKCLVECHNPMETFVGNTLGSNIGHFTLTKKNRYQIKLNPHITIYPVEERAFPLWKVKELCDVVQGTNFTQNEYEEWFEQNVK